MRPREVWGSLMPLRGSPETEETIVGYDGETLAYTGPIGLTILGVHVGLSWVLVVGIALVLVGALLYRYAARRKHRRAA